MEFNSSHHNAPPPPLQLLPPNPSSAMSYFAHQALRGGNIQPDHARPNNFSSHPSNAHISLLREMEKQKIREEIIAAEVRRLQLEAEVRREMLMERELALGGTHGFPLLSGPLNMLVNPGLPILNHSETRFRDALLILNHSENIFKEKLPLGHQSEGRITEMKAAPEVKKEKFIHLPKPEENVSGIKRKAMTPPETNPTRPSADPEEKPREKWYCELCQVSATSEAGLNDHFEGKKHKSREAKQSSQINGQTFLIGLGKPINGPKKPEEIKEYIEEEPKEAKQAHDDVALQVKKNSEVIEKEEVATSKKVKKNKFNHAFWCEMCRIGAFSQNVMDTHMRGKKHKALFLESLTSRLAAASDVAIAGVEN